ncbi:hypothetical protein JG688_00008914 [Phytophthora aleatoria]|uniref:HECT E3 ubiquitin ligase n=1 Tax=Phytophthora aleatoria TaxID=2496075 RepID=A0A8J5IHB2_9STRA|nr:hypothetical protein JG688_00008914 [Phytophthora aleatoria]
MEQPSAPSRGGRKRRVGKRKRSTSRHNEDEERKTEEPPPKQEEEDKQEEKQEDKTPQKWSCPACTFLNEASRCFCEMCETPNPSPSVSRGLGAAASDWSCAACTMVNPAAMRVCGVCGTLNPRPALPSGLSIRLSEALGGGGDESFSSSSEDSEDSDSDDEEEDTWTCTRCDTLSGGCMCPNCFAQRPKAAQKAADEDKSKEKKQAKKQKRRKHEKLQERAKLAYGISICELKKLVLEPTGSRLVDTLQTLTHTLAMMDASADNEWADGPSFLVRGFGGGRSSETAKDPELLTMLADIFRGQERTYPVEVRLLAVQSINYLMKMDRHMIARAKMVEVVGLYLSELLAWKDRNSTDTRSTSDSKSSQMIVEECLSGLSSVCSTEAFALRELLVQGRFLGYLDFLLSLVDGNEKDGGFHPSIVMTALGILQKCCMKLRWSAKSNQKHRLNDSKKSSAASPKKLTQGGWLTLELATKLIGFLRHALEHKHVPLHVKAAKCLLQIFHRTPHDQVGELVTPEILRKFVAVVANTDDSIPAVNVLLKDGADLNFPKMYDVQGNEIDKPLNVAVESGSLGMCKLIESVEVYEGVTLDLALFGSPDAVDSGGNSDGKKKRKNNKRKRKASTQKQQPLESEDTLQVEVKNAEAVMKMHAKRKAILDVVFVGEKGYGSGVTAAFYSTTAHALQVVTENQKNRYWIPGEDDAAEAVKAEARRIDDVGVADDATVIRHSNGLFPYPHRKPSPKLVERFRMMGRLAGKALMDERLLPLPLSPQFMKLVVGESFGLEELGDIFLSHGRILYSMYKASKKLVAGEQNVQIDQMDVQDWLEAVGFTFIDPFSQESLVAGGDDVAVTASNLTLYVRAVLELWLDSGIRAQVLAFREGISEVLPVGKLRLLFVPELISLLCGEEDIEWNVESLVKDTKLAHGYTKDSQPVQFFFEALEEMSATERRAFLLYATGCPNLPPGGFQALKPPFEVVRRVVDSLDVDRALPFARTCTNTLHLPAYSSKDVLAKQLAFAIANSRGVIDRD